MRLIEPVLHDAAAPRPRGDPGERSRPCSPRARRSRRARRRTRTRSRSSTPSSSGCAPCACSTPPAARATSSTSRCRRSRTSSARRSSGRRSRSKMPMQFPQVGPQAVLGIEINPYAAELARVVIWIGEIQWMLSNGFAYARDPILKPLDTIEQRDAVLDLSDPEQPARARLARRHGDRRQPAVPGGEAAALRTSATSTSTRSSRCTTAESPAWPTSAPTGTRRPGPWWRRDELSASASWQLRAYAAVAAGRRWSASRSPETSSWRGPMSPGCLTGRPSTCLSSASTTARRQRSCSTESRSTASTPT